MTNGQEPGGGAGDSGHGFDRSEEFAELAAELRLLLEVALERLEPGLRKAALGIGQAEWDSCSWCPVCALAALVRGQRHDLVAAVAEHGTAIVTVLREALAGEPVEPVFPAADARSAAGAAPETADGQAAGYTEIPVTIR